MFPLRDENPSARFPLVSRGFIALNCALFLYEVTLGPQLRGFIFQFGLIPARTAAGLFEGQLPLAETLFPFLTSMFLHGGWMHLIGNMWYLWIFGDNVEDRFGHLGFIFFYLTGGLVASAVHFAANPGSMVPTVGASGAIAAVLGAYAVAFPRARVITLVPLFPFWQVMALPAVLVLGFWFVLQFFTGVLSLGSGASGGGGVAWWAHIGGFVFGMLVMRVAGRRRPPERY